MTDATAKFKKLCELTDDLLSKENPATRDRRMQQFIAAAQTPTERFQSLSHLVDFGLALKNEKKRK